MRRLNIVRFASMSIAVCVSFVASIAAPPEAPNAALPHDGMVRYDGHRIVRVDVESARDLQAALALTPDVWSHHLGPDGELDVRIPPEAMPVLEASGLEYDVLIEDVQTLIDAQFATLERDGGDGGDQGIADDEWFLDFKTYDQINAYLADLAATRPNLARVVVLGQSLEGRAIHGLEIAGPNGALDPAVRPSVLYNGCQHAREWVSPMTATYIADQLVRGYGMDPGLTDLLDNSTVYVAPVVNPDGYVYTWTTDRLWRKNRRNNGNGSFGVDLNRNWGFEWGGVGSSSNGFSETYRGAAPFSEPETQALRDFILDRPWIVKHVDIHSYGQLLLNPWGYTSDPTTDAAAFDALAYSAAAAIQSEHGMAYTPGQWYFTLYPSSGIAVDWLYAERGAWSFTYELRDTGQFGFVLPKEQILPTAQEIFAAAMSLATSDSEVKILLDATPLVRGQDATLSVQRGTPDERVHFVYGFDGYGSTFVPQLNVTLDLDTPQSLGAALADANGEAALTRRVPTNAPPGDVYLQAIQRERRSNVKTTEIE